MWLRLDRADNSMAFLENMDRRPVTSSEWKTYDIETSVPEDASRIVLGVMLFGLGTAWVDDVTPTDDEPQYARTNRRGSRVQESGLKLCYHSHAFE